MNEKADLRQKQKAREEVFDQFYDLQSVVSAQGMTGLTPDLPQSEGEIESYSRLQGIPKRP